MPNEPRQPPPGETLQIDETDVDGPASDPDLDTVVEHMGEAQEWLEARQVSEVLGPVVRPDQAFSADAEPASQVGNEIAQLWHETGRLQREILAATPSAALLDSDTLVVSGTGRAAGDLPVMSLRIESHRRTRERARRWPVWLAGVALAAALLLLLFGLRSGT